MDYPTAQIIMGLAIFKLRFTELSPRELCMYQQARDVVYRVENNQEEGRTLTSDIQEDR